MADIAGLLRTLIQAQAQPQAQPPPPPPQQQQQQQEQQRMQLQQLLLQEQAKLLAAVAASATNSSSNGNNPPPVAAPAPPVAATVPPMNNTQGVAGSSSGSNSATTDLVNALVSVLASCVNGNNGQINQQASQPPPPPPQLDLQQLLRQLQPQQPQPQLWAGINPNNVNNSANHNWSQGVPGLAPAVGAGAAPGASSINVIQEDSSDESAVARSPFASAIHGGSNGVGSSSSGDGQHKLKFRRHHPGLWMKRYKELEAHREKLGHCLVDPNEFPALSHWVKRQRYQYKLRLDGRHSTMTDERQQMLERLGFVWDSHDAIWEQRFNDLLVFKKMNGHTNVPVIYKPNPQLGVWVKGQRKQYLIDLDKGIHLDPSLRAGRYQKLRSIGFKFVLRPSRVKSLNRRNA